MSTEAGDKKVLGNLRALIDHISAEANYHPANSKLSKASLEAQYTAAQTAADAVANAQAPNKLAITARFVGFTGLRPRAVRVHNALKSSGATPPEVEDAETPYRKLIGTRKTPKIKDNPATPEDESKGSKSASQMSYDNQLGNLGAYLAILSNIPAYNPNEADLKIPALQATAADLKAKNDAVSTTSVTLSQARGVRDQALYLADDSVVNIAQLVKTYVKAAFGTSHQLYKQIKGLQFTRAPK